MKPRNNEEREVLRLSALLPILSDKEEEWAISNADDAYPKDKHRFDGYVYFPTTIGRWQVLRMFYVNRKDYVRDSAYHKKGDSFGYCEEVLQKWIKTDVKPMKIITIGVPLKMMCNWTRNPFGSYHWALETDPTDEEKLRLFRDRQAEMSIKVKLNNSSTYYNSHYYHDWRNLPMYPDGDWLRGMGIVKDSLKAGCSIDWWDEGKNTYLETLLELKRFNIVRNIIGNHRYTDVLPAVKIVMRNGGFPRRFDWTMWFDHLSVMKTLKMDLHNPKLLMPDNLKETHVRLVAKLQRVRDREREERRREEEKKQMETNKALREGILKRGKVWGEFRIKENGLTFVPLITISDYHLEGKVMHHCVGGYYGKFNSLILSARDDNGKTWETIEVRLVGEQAFSIIQCYGACDHFTERHNEIKDIVMNHMEEIKSIQRKSERAKKLTAVAV